MILKGALGSYFSTTWLKFVVFQPKWKTDIIVYPCFLLSLHYLRQCKLWSSCGKHNYPTTEHDIYGLLTKCEVKMAGYWPSSFFACLWTETELRSINMQKKEWGQYPAILTEQVWSIKDLSYGFRGNISCRTRRVVPSGQNSSILPARIANPAQDLTHLARSRS